MSREMLYRWHPWCGAEVWIHETIEKASGVVFRCALSRSAASRGLEVPSWMFDRAACVEREMLSVAPYVSLDALSALASLLADVSKARAATASLNVSLSGTSGASKVSRDQNRGQAHAGKDSSERRRGATEEQARPSASAAADGVIRKRGGWRADRRAEVDRPAGRDAADGERTDDALAPGACRPESSPLRSGGRS